MGKVVGIDVGNYAVKVVEIDGSYRKTRLLRCRVEPLPPVANDTEPRPAVVAEAVKKALDEGRLSRGDLRLGYPCREATLRSIEVPFTGHDAIRKVIKSEVEGEIHSQSVDDMVVDFQEVGSTADGTGTRVLAAAVPKAGVRSLLDGLAERGLEPEHVDLDTMALWRLADWCGAFAAPEVAEGEAKSELPAPVAGQKPTALRAAVLDLGSHSTRVLLVADGKLVDMRVLRVGDGAVAEELARKNGIPVAAARTAIAACTSTAGDFTVEIPEVLPAPTDGAAAADAPANVRKVTIALDEVEAAQTAWLQRLARELVRFLVAVGENGKVASLWVTGGASTMPGMRELLREVFGTEPRDLDVMARLQHDLPPEEAATLGPRIATAVGLALAPFGGPDGFQLRQEDLAYTRGFDRVKFPLAIFCMVAIFAGVVWNVKLGNDLKGQELILGRTYQDEAGKQPVFFGMLYQLVNDRGWFADDRNFEKKDYKKLLDDLRALPVTERVRYVYETVRKVAQKKQQESGQYEDLTLESGLAVLARFAEVLKAKENELGRYLLFEVDLSLSGSGAGRSLKFTIGFRTAGAVTFRDRLAVLKAAFDEEAARADSPFMRSKDSGSAIDEAKERIWVDGDKTDTQGAYFECRIPLREVIPPFTGREQPQPPPPAQPKKEPAK